MIGKPDDDDAIDWGEIKSPGSGVTAGAHTTVDEARGAQRPEQNSNDSKGGQGAYGIKDNAIVQASETPALSTPPFSITASNGDNGRGLQQTPTVFQWKMQLYELGKRSADELIAKHLADGESLAAQPAEAWLNTVRNWRKHPDFWHTNDPAGLSQTEIEEELGSVAQALIKKYELPAVNSNGNCPPERALSIIIETDEAADKINAEYLARPEVIERLGYSQSIALIIGAKHHGKSTVTRSLALSVPRGLPVWGRRTSQGPVVYAASDDEVAATRAQLLEMGWRKGKDALYFVHINPTSDATAEQILEDIGNIAVQNKAAMIVLDMLFDFVGIKDELSYSETRTRIGQVQKLADTTKCFVLGTHHTPKYLTEAHEAANAALGSQGVSARFSPIILVRKYADRLFTIESTPTRDPRGEALKPTRINKDDNGWISLGTEFRELDKWEIYAQRVLDLFEQHKGLSVSDVVQRLSLDRARVQNTLKQLESNGSLTREKLGHRYLYYRVES